jgi:hypothetical protein
LNTSYLPKGPLPSGTKLQGTKLPGTKLPASVLEEQHPLAAVGSNEVEIPIAKKPAMEG